MKVYLKAFLSKPCLSAKVLVSGLMPVKFGLMSMFLLLNVLLPLVAEAFYFQNSNTLTPPDSTVKVEARLSINKISNIEATQETYWVDGDLKFIWYDERHQSVNDTQSELIFEDEFASGLMKTDVWVPMFEFTNIQGTQNIQSIKLKILPEEGIVIYEEQFFGVFHTEMDFTKFPFDEKSFVVEIEPFSYDQTRLIFDRICLFPTDNAAMDMTLGKDWKLLNTRAVRDSSVYEIPNGSRLNNSEYVFSKAVFEVNAKRNYGNYLWQVLFPLLIIIISSFSIFWIHDFGTQIGVGLFLLLTVVAFNFYFAPTLPELPYKTFIDNVITSGYTLISAIICFSFINHNRMKNMPEKSDLRYIFKIAIPLIYIIIMGTISAYTFL